MDEGRLDIDVLLSPSVTVPMTMLSTASPPAVAVTVLLKTGTPDDVDQDTETGGDKHHLGVYLELHADHPEHGHVDQDSSDHPDHQH